MSPLRGSSRLVLFPTAYAGGLSNFRPIRGSSLSFFDSLEWLKWTVLSQEHFQGWYVPRFSMIPRFARETLHATSLPLDSLPVHNCRLGYSNCGTALVIMIQSLLQNRSTDEGCGYFGTAPITWDSGWIRKQYTSIEFLSAEAAICQTVSRRNRPASTKAVRAAGRRRIPAGK